MIGPGDRTGRLDEGQDDELARAGGDEGLHRGDERRPAPGHELGGVREVGEKCSILIPGVEVVMVNQKTGEKNKALVGDYLITIERVE